MNGYGDCLTCKSFSKSAFSCIDKDTITKTITGASVSINFKKGQDIYLEGTPSKGVFCVQSGKVKVYKKCLERNLTIGLGSNSDLLGLASMFNGGVYTNSAKCLEDSHICFVPKKTFVNLLSSNQDMMMNMLKQSCTENGRLSNILRDLKCRNTLSRLACAVHTMYDRFGLDENKCINITLTRKEISEIAGTTTESAIRILNDLKKEKVIAFYNNKIRILDMDKLLKF